MMFPCIQCTVRALLNLQRKMVLMSSVLKLDSGCLKPHTHTLSLYIYVYIYIYLSLVVNKSDYD